MSGYAFGQPDLRTPPVCVKRNHRILTGARASKRLAGESSKRSQSSTISRMNGDRREKTAMAHVRGRSVREAEREHRSRIEEAVQRRTPSCHIDFEAARHRELETIAIEEVSALHLERERRRNQGRRG